MLTKIFAVLFSLALSLSCGAPARSTTDSGVPTTSSAVGEVSVGQADVAVSKAYAQFVDVRTPDEYAAGHAARAINLPLDQLTNSLGTLERNEPVYLICETGNRSKKAAAILKDAGFNNVFSVSGGTQAWRSAGLPIETQPPHRSNSL